MDNFSVEFVGFDHTANYTAKLRVAAFGRKAINTVVALILEERTK